MRRLAPYPAGPQIERKIGEKHGVVFHEVEELFARRAVVLRGPIDQYGERRYTALGRSAAGRYLMVVYTATEAGRAKVITAREMIDRERTLYRRKKGRTEHGKTK